ncbi:MAG: hypothetical protein QF699_07210 [Candidatus Poseidoniaceae archaeon]|jgi:hypothetical protein|nr:hypothetical protein [Candidatus Poseidoniaceae archaeon]
MELLYFHQLAQDIRASMQGKRWLMLTAADLPHATAALAFSELEDVLVAVDHRDAPLEEGLWMRAVHLLVVSPGADCEAIQTRSGITKVVATNEDMEEQLW